MSEASDLQKQIDALKDAESFFAISFENKKVTMIAPHGMHLAIPAFYSVKALLDQMPKEDMRNTLTMRLGDFMGLLENSISRIRGQRDQ